MTSHTRPLIVALAVLSTVAPRASAQAPPARESTKARAFEVKYPSIADGKPITGRVYVMLGPVGSRMEPRLGPNWFRPEPMFSSEVKDWRAGDAVRIDAKAVGYPKSLDAIEPGEYVAQAVVRINPDSANIGTGEGNLYGPAVPVKLEADAAAPISLEVTRRVPPRDFKETGRVKLAELESPLLSRFFGRPIKHRAAVILPESNPGGKRPAVYIIPGFGGDHTMATRLAGSPMGKDLIRVVLDPNCYTGHHVFADSATNGPRGKALVEEFIPYLESKFPILAEPRARLLNGHSSGGWSSLWLQVTYPDVFGGTWSTSPDPVDFRDFQRVDIYAKNQNIYRDPKGERRAVARRGGKPIIFYDDFSKLEEAMGPGGQLGSFEAVFSPVKDGKPARLWDRTTGAIDPEVAKAWEAYDIRLVLERNWAEKGPKLKGKIHVITGGEDTFFLEGAVKLLKESLAKLGSDAVLDVIPGRDHSTVMDRALVERINREMNAAVDLK
ncbi:alpha/beta hydrolase [Aquisphaera insulae]|uniref:alpha/beta hydrolase n=1 Tax=Aquisphaera insulae TaxID=2712864 RepID=UPI0013ED40E4|nr:alpha/beta hydrolase [Aquisphaera insulae]